MRQVFDAGFLLDEALAHHEMLRLVEGLEAYHVAVGEVLVLQLIAEVHSSCE